jgi:hypothetical protein
MPKVRNDTSRAVPLCRWRILPDNRVINPLGEIKDELPADIAYGPQAKRLADQKIIAIEGYVVEGQEMLYADKPKAKEEPKPAEKAKAPVAAAPKAVVPPPPSDLTDLIHIGTGRARKLNAEGVKTFQDVVDLGAEELDSMLQIDKAMAEAVVEDAKSKLG